MSKAAKSRAPVEVAWRPVEEASTLTEAPPKRRLEVRG